MVDLLSIGISAFVAFAVSFFVVIVRYILVDKRKYKREEKRKTLSERLDKFYSPVNMFIQFTKQVPARMSDKQLLAFALDEPERADFDNAIAQYSYLASDELQPLLDKVHKFALLHISEEEATRIVNLIESDYQNLRDEYYSL